MSAIHSWRIHVKPRDLVAQARHNDGVDGVYLAELLAIGCDLADLGRQDDAAICFRQAADLGCAQGAFNLANTLVAQGQLVDAVAMFELALQRGETDAWLNLGNVLDDLGDLAGSMHAYAQAEAVGDPGGPLGLAFSLREQGDRQAAMAAAQRSAAMEYPLAAAVLACWQYCLTNDPALEAALRAGAEHYSCARADLGMLLRTAGRIDEAQTVLQRGMALGEIDSVIPLSNLFSDDLDDDESAEAVLRVGVDQGDAYAHHNLAVLLEERDDVEEAVWHYRIAAADGDELALAALQDFADD